MTKSGIRIKGVAVLATVMSFAGPAWLARPIEAQTMTVGSPQIIANTYNLTGVACGLTCHAIGYNNSGAAVVVSDINAYPQAQPVPGVTQLFSIACPPAPANGTCYAVGVTTNPLMMPEPAVVVPITTGESGDVIGTPIPIPDTGGLASITCPTDTTCYAVGTGGNGFISGTATVSIPIGNISNSQVIVRETITSYVAVACPSTSICYAVGSQSGTAVVASYTIPRIGVPSNLPVFGTPVGDLNAIACPSSSTCFALGVLSDNPGLPFLTGQAAVIQIANGGFGELGWIPYTGLRGVACPASDACLVVGSGSDTATDMNSGELAGSVILLTQSYWQSYSSYDYGDLSSLNTPAAGTQSLNSIACSDEVHCYAVGSDAQEPGGVVVPVTLSPACPVCPSGSVCETPPGTLQGACVYPAPPPCGEGYRLCPGSSACWPVTRSCPIL
jgi:hypothetical protein